MPPPHPGRLQMSFHAPVTRLRGQRVGTKAGQDAESPGLSPARWQPPRTSHRGANSVHACPVLCNRGVSADRPAPRTDFHSDTPLDLCLAGTLGTRGLGLQTSLS